jgi:hypothetical protein
MIDDIDDPLPTDDSGRDKKGRFGKGNRAGQGNPKHRKIQKLKSALLDAVSAADIKSVVKQLVKSAKDGDVQAAKLLFDRVIGPIKEKIDLSGVIEHEHSGEIVVVQIPAMENDRQSTRS